MYKTIPLTRGKVAILDVEDHDRVSAHKWYALKSNGGFYAARQEYQPKQHVVLMHREILGLTDSTEQGDHINGDTLDNRRANLRHASQQQNCCNIRRAKNNRSGFKGVYFHRQGKCWAAQIQYQGKRIYLGTFRAPGNAALAYDAAARKYFGEFARLNFA